MPRLILCLALLLLTCCKEGPAATSVQDKGAGTEQPTAMRFAAKEEQVSALDLTFFSDSILHGQKPVLGYYFTKYGSRNCEALYYMKNQIKADFEGLYKVGVIRKGRSASVFVLNPLTRCEPDSSGQAYYFTDTTLPRLLTESDCCHPNNIFAVGDIDEDGISEIGQYYSGCASRYKLLRVYSLRKNEWHEVGSCVYDLAYANADKPYNSFVRKRRRNKFEMLEITDLTSDKRSIGKPRWLQFSM
jgi:hypothetical protein